MAPGGGWALLNSLGAASTCRPEVCSERREARKLASEAIGIVKGVGRGVLGDHAKVDGDVSEGSRGRSGVWAAGFLGQRDGEVEARVVTPQPPFAPRKTKDFLAVLWASARGGGGELRPGRGHRPYRRWRGAALRNSAGAGAHALMAISRSGLAE